MSEQLNLFSIKARNTDPNTSHKAAEKVLTMRAGSQRWKLLKAFVEYKHIALTDEEAAAFARLSLTSEYATRCSELRNHGFIAPTGEERIGSQGMKRILSTATTKGIEVFRDA